MSRLINAMYLNEPCSSCSGRGFIIDEPCPVCESRGRILIQSKIPIEIPAGVNQGSVLRVAGAGHKGHLSGTSGDLYVVTNVAQDPVFHRQGQNLHVKVHVPVEKLILGGEVEYPLPLGGKQRANVPPCRPGHWSFAVDGHGVPFVNNDRKRGSLVVTLVADFPEILNLNERNILEQYAQERKKSSSETKETQSES